MPLKKLMEDQLNKQVQEIPDIRDITLGELNSTLSQIDNEYPWQMPTWLKIFLSIITTIVIIGIIIICCICRARGIYVEEHLLNWCSKKSNARSSLNDHLDPKNFSTMKDLWPMHITHPARSRFL